MKLWLDDEYEARKSWFPSTEGWTHCRWPSEVLEHLKTGTVKELSLDHDLGEGNECLHPRTGYDVLVWLEEQVATGQWKFPLPTIRIHSRNSVGRDRMKAAIRSIIQYHQPTRREYRDV